MNVVHTGIVQTVAGRVSANSLGLMLTHEHLLFRAGTGSGINAASAMVGASELGLGQEEISLENRFRYQYATSTYKNGWLLSEQEAVAEAESFMRSGGGTIVDATSIGIGRDPRGLFRVGRASGINIIMGASYYVAEFHPPHLSTMTDEQIADIIVADISDGVGETGIKAGFIGEIGTTYPWGENEKRILMASAHAQHTTGAVMLIHPGRHEDMPLEIVCMLLDVGVQPDRIIMGHLDRTIFDRRRLNDLADTGCYLEYDLFGRELPHYPVNMAISMPNDQERIATLRWLISEGHTDRIVLAHDICSRTRFEKYGGHGFAHLIERIPVRLAAAGIERHQIKALLVDNPQRAFSLIEERP